TIQDCITNFLLIPRSSEQILALLSRIQQKDNIKRLDLSNQLFSTSEDSLVRILPMIQNHMAATLEEIYLNTTDSASTKLELANVQAIADFLSKVNLQIFSLQNQHIGVNNSLILISGLLNSTLTVLDLSANDLGIQGIQALAAILPFVKLKTLILKRNNLG